MVLSDSRPQARQWDHGLLVKFSVSDGVSAGDEIHIAPAGCQEAKTSVVFTEGGQLLCKIPDEFLWQEKDLRLHAYIEDETSGRTIRTWVLPIGARAKPEDFATEPAELQRWHEISDALTAESSTRAADDRALSNRITVATNIARGKMDNPTGGTAGQVLTKTETGQEWQTPSGYTKPSGGIPKSDLAAAVRTSLGKADTATQIPTIEADTLVDVINEMDEDTRQTAIAGFSGFYINDNGEQVNYTEPKQLVQLYDPGVGITYAIICIATGRIYYFDEQMSPRMKYTADEALEGLATLAAQIDEDIGL